MADKRVDPESQPNPALYPLTFSPAYKDYTWGGRNLATQLGRTLPDGIVAESWDVAAHPNGASIVRAGALAGETLTAVMARWGESLVGTRNREALGRGRFPLLIKLLDARRWLSVQVHPDDDYARAHAGDLGKTEMWVVLHAEPDSEVIFGFAPGTTRQDFADALAKGDPEPFLHRVRVGMGDVVFVPAGAIHALGPGLIVAEIQQNSDTTYRIYDWGRPRPLHIEQALEVLDFGLVAPEVVKPQRLAETPVRELLAECAYFRTERLTLRSGVSVQEACTGATFEIWGVLQGAIRLTHSGAPVELAAVDWVLLPAAMGGYAIEASADAVLLRVTTPAEAADV